MKGDIGETDMVDSQAEYRQDKKTEGIRGLMVWFTLFSHFASLI